MNTFEITAEITDDRQLLLSFPPDVPLGKAKLRIMVEPVGRESVKKQPRSSLAEWAEKNGENWKGRLNSTDVHFQQAGFKALLLE